MAAPEKIRPEDTDIALLWLRFASVAVPNTASQVQRADMRMCFYEGFIWAFQLLQEITGALPEGKAVEVVERLRNEIVMYTKTEDERHE